jgi:hypothetical protein
VGVHVQYFDLPQEVVDFLKAGKQFEYDPSACEPGAVKLKKLDEVKLDEIYVNSCDSPIETEDPHAGENGYYAVQAVNLVGECKAYRAEGILIWIPDYKVFGQWDCDHGSIMIFPQISWTDIVDDPAYYLGAQWAPLESDEYLKPWDKCEFKPGLPPRT